MSNYPKVMYSQSRQQQSQSQQSQQPQVTLAELERKLEQYVDSDFFQDPKTYKPISRVIDIIGALLASESSLAEKKKLDAIKSARGNSNMPANSNYMNHSNKQNINAYNSLALEGSERLRDIPSFLALKQQQKTVEEVIEKLSVVYCSDLNASVALVGKMANQFGQAVQHVKDLQKQVSSIRDGFMDPNSHGNNRATLLNTIMDGHTAEEKVDMNANDMVTTAISATGAGIAISASSNMGGSAKSLREVWFKKLECESVLALLQKLEIIRDASPSFDSLVHLKPCRVAAAVVLLSSAIDTIFSSSHLDKIMGVSKIFQQLMARKQLAEDILWNTLQDILYLRTGNYPMKDPTPTSPLLLSSMDENNNNSILNKRRKSAVMDETPLIKDQSFKSSSSMSGGLYGKNGSVAKRHPIARRNRSGPQKFKYITLSTPTQTIRQQAIIEYGNDGDIDFLEIIANLDGGGGDGGDDAAGDDDESTSLFSSSVDFVVNDHHHSNLHRSKATPSSEEKNDSSNVLNAKEVDYRPFLIYGREKGRLLSRSVLDSKIEVIVDEMRCLQNWDLSSSYYIYDDFQVEWLNRSNTIGPVYTDPVLALRITLDALVRMKRIDDVERVLTENAEREIQQIAMCEQAKTLSRLGALGSSVNQVNRMNNDDNSEDKLLHFKVHLHSLLMAFGGVLMRLTYLAQILRHRIMTDKMLTKVTPSYPVKSSALRSVITNVENVIQRELLGFLRGCLYEEAATATGSAKDKASRSKGLDKPRREQGIFSLGIITDSSLASSIKEKNAQNLLSVSRISAMRMSAEHFVRQILCVKTGVSPEIVHALAFRKSISTWTTEYLALKKELIEAFHEDIALTTTTEETAMTYLDEIIGKSLLPAMQDKAVNETVSVLERADAFDPIVGTGTYRSANSKGNKYSDVPICLACQVLSTSTSYLFGAIPKMNTNSDIYLSLVASLEHAVLTFISRVKQRVVQLCQGKTAYQLIENEGARVPTPLSYDMELRRPFTQLLNSYFDIDNLTLSVVTEPAIPRVTNSSIPTILPSNADTQPRVGVIQEPPNPEDVLKGLNVETHLQREQETFEREVSHLGEFLDFSHSDYSKKFKLCSEEDFMKIASLSHSLLTVSRLLEKRLRPKNTASVDVNVLQIPRTLREPIKAMRLYGLKMAKFCRMELLLQVINRLSVVYKSSSLTSQDVVRVPTCIQELGEYLSQTSELLRAFGGNILAAYSFSSLEQYSPLLMMTNVRIIALGGGDMRITLQGVEALDKGCSMLYRDLKGATSFENSFWDDEVAYDAFERAVNFIALMELDMEELVSLVRNQEWEFTEEDYRIMFAMDGPRRNGDLNRFSALKERMRG